MQDVAEAVAAASAAFPAWSALTVKRRAAVSVVCRAPRRGALWSTCRARRRVASRVVMIVFVRDVKHDRFLNLLLNLSAPCSCASRVAVDSIRCDTAAVRGLCACRPAAMKQYMYKFHELLEAATDELTEIVVRVS